MKYSSYQNSQQQYKRRPYNMVSQYRQADTVHTRLDEFIQSSLDKYAFVEVTQEMLDSASIYSKHIVSNKPAIPDLVIYNKKFNKNECFVEADTTKFNPFPSNFSNSAHKYGNYFESTGKLERGDFGDEDEKIEWEKVNVEEILHKDEIQFQTVPKNENAEENKPEELLNSPGIHKIPEENLIPMNINSLFDQNQNGENNDPIDFGERMLTDDFNIDQEIEKLRKNFGSEGSTTLNLLNNNNNYNSNEVLNNDFAKESVNLKPFFVKKAEDKNDDDEEIDMPSLFADLTLFNKTMSTPNKKQNTLEEFSNKDNQHIHINNLMNNNPSFNDQKQHEFSHSHNPTHNHNHYVNNQVFSINNNRFNYMNNNVNINSLQNNSQISSGFISHPQSINQQNMFFNHNHVHLINNRTEIESKAPQNVSPINKRSLNKFNIANNLKAGLMINTNENVLNQQRLPNVFLTPNQTNNNQLSITPKQIDQPLTPQHTISTIKMNGLENPLHLILKNINVKGWRVVESSGNESINNVTSKLMNSFELYCFLEFELNQGKNLNNFTINDVDLETVVVPNILYDCLKENHILIKEKTGVNSTRNANSNNSLNLGPSLPHRKGLTNKYSMLENFSTNSTQNSSIQQPKLNKLFSHDAVNMNKYNNLPLRSRTLINTNSNTINSSNNFDQSNQLTNNINGMISGYIPFNVNSSISPINRKTGEIGDNFGRNNFCSQGGNYPVPILSPNNQYEMSKQNFYNNNQNSEQIRQMNFNFNVNFVNSELNLNNNILNTDEKKEHFGQMPPFFSPENKKSILNSVYFTNNDVNENNFKNEFCQRQIEKSTPMKNIKNKFNATYEKSRNATPNIDNKTLI